MFFVTFNFLVLKKERKKYLSKFCKNLRNLSILKKKKINKKFHLFFTLLSDVRDKSMVHLDKRGKWTKCVQKEFSWGKGSRNYIQEANRWRRASEQIKKEDQGRKRNRRKTEDVPFCLARGRPAIEFTAWLPNGHPLARTKLVPPSALSS